MLLTFALILSTQAKPVANPVVTHGKATLGGDWAIVSPTVMSFTPALPLTKSSAYVFQPVLGSQFITTLFQLHHYFPSGTGIHTWAHTWQGAELKVPHSSGSSRFFLSSTRSQRHIHLLLISSYLLTPTLEVPIHSPFVVIFNQPVTNTILKECKLSKVVRGMLLNMLLSFINYCVGKKAFADLAIVSLDDALNDLVSNIRGKEKKRIDNI